MSLKQEGVKFSQFISGLQQISENERATAKAPVSNAAGQNRNEPLSNYEGARSLQIVSNPEYVYAVVDSNNVFLFGVKKDGSIEWAKGIPTHIQKEITEELVKKVDKVEGRSLVDSVFACAQSNSNNPEYLKIIVDSVGKVIEAINKDGQHEFFVKPKFNAGVEWSIQNLTELEKALKENGYNGGCGDWSDKTEISIPTPRLAIINISGVDSLPTSKTSNLEAVFEFWDLNGNYFKKKIKNFNAQGNSSLNYPKKNVSFDFKDLKLKIGSWVSQDSFHIKAFYTDYFRGIGEVGYDFYKSILDTYENDKNRTWKLALVNQEGVGAGLGVGVTTDNSLKIDDGALCFPMGFPCVMYLNGTFNGVYAFQLKKHRDNYMMGKSNAKHIHMDATGFTFFGGNIDWTAFEIRNPKGLKDVDGNDYDGDNPKELSSEGFSGQVKSSIISLSQIASQVNAAGTTEAKKAILESRFDIANIIDYIIFNDVTSNIDAFGGNWQWTTWDGEKWYVNVYDLDGVFGASFQGDAIRLPSTVHLGQNANYPTKFVTTYYSNELKARYAELRSLGVVSQKSIVCLVDSWVKRIGLDFLKKEYEKWSDSPCNRDIVINDSYWELKKENGKPVIDYGSGTAYSSSTNYSVGDECCFQPATGSGISWKYVFVCKANSIGNVPATKSGFRDSIWRLNNWVKQSLENMDNLYNYEEN